MIQYILFFFLSILLNEVRCQLSSKAAFEGKCIEPTPKVPAGVNYFWIFAPGVSLFLPMGSQHMYRSYAEYLIGRSPHSQKELESMNLKIANIGPFVTNSGFGQSFSQFCMPFNHSKPNIADMKCISSFGTAKANTTLINFTHDVLVWTDNYSAMLYVRCISNEKDFKVLSPFRKIREPARQEILKIVKNLGFSEKSVMYLPYY